jgi:hypothetical protein
MFSFLKWPEVVRPLDLCVQAPAPAQGEIDEEIDRKEGKKQHN